MLISTFLFHKCSTTIHTVAINSGIPKGAVTTDTPFKQYTTSNPIIAVGNTLPRYITNFGVSLFSGNNTNGKKRVTIVPAAIAKILINVCKGVKNIINQHSFHLKFYQLFLFYKLILLHQYF